MVEGATGGKDGSSRSAHDPRLQLAAAHARFARVVLAIYLGAAAVALGLFVATLTADFSHEQQQNRDMLELVTQARAQYLARHLGLLARELTRLGLRSEVDLLDQNLEPERDLLRLTHRKSAFFNVGVAIVSAAGKVEWSEPQHFLPEGTSFSKEAWFATARTRQELQIVAIQPEAEQDSIIYVVSPIMRSGEFAGALVGAVDLAMGGAMDPVSHFSSPTLALLVTQTGTVVYPPKPPGFSATHEWKTVVGNLSRDALMMDTRLLGKPTFVAGAPVGASDLTLLSIIETDVLFEASRARLVTRLALGLFLAVVPLAILVYLLRRSLQVFKSAEEEAVREERLALLGEAANLIAHEIKNSLSGFNVGLDLVAMGTADTDSRQSRALKALRTEIKRLSDFTSELLLFSKGVVPRPSPIDLAKFVRRVAELYEESAQDQGVILEIVTPDYTVPVRSDPALIHVIVSNLITNSFDALASADLEAPGVKVEVTVEGRHAMVRVSDNGPGVIDAVRPRLFEPFVTGKPSGTGIGLSLSRKIARAHGGDLQLERTAAGASFLLTLKAESASQPLEPRALDAEGEGAD